MMMAMKRRDFVKAIGIASVSAAGTGLAQQKPSVPPTNPPPDGASPVQPGASVRSSPQTAVRRSVEYKAAPIPTAVPDVIAETEAHFFTPVQFATLHKLCEVLMPSMSGYPGAVAAGAPEFLNFLVGASPAERQGMYRSGLDRLSSDAQKQFGTPFASVSKEQADKLIRPFLETWMTNHPPTEPHKRFINVAHRDIRTATINSQAWSAAAVAAGERAPGVSLYWSPIDPDIKLYV